MWLSLVLPAFGVDIDVGIGGRQVSTIYDGFPTSVHAFGRLGFSPRFALDLGLSVRPPSDAVSGLANTLVAIAYEGNNATTFRVPVTREVFALTMLAEVSPWERRHDRKTTAWVYAAFGLDIGLLRRDVASLNPGYASGDTLEPAIITIGPVTPAFRPAAGLGFDLFFFDRVGARILWLERLSMEEEPDYGNRLANGEPEPLETAMYLSSAVSIDFLVSF